MPLAIIWSYSGQYQAVFETETLLSKEDIRAVLDEIFKQVGQMCYCQNFEYVCKLLEEQYGWKPISGWTTAMWN